jgi:hypothetical protein
MAQCFHFSDSLDFRPTGSWQTQLRQESLHWVMRWEWSVNTSAPTFKKFNAMLLWLCLRHLWQPKLCFLGQILLCKPSWPVTYDPPEYWDYRFRPPGPVGLNIYLFYHFCIYSHVYTLFRTHPIPQHPRHPDSGQSLFCLLVLQLSWRGNIRDNKKDSVFASLR